MNVDAFEDVALPSSGDEFLYSSTDTLIDMNTLDNLKSYYYNCTKNILREFRDEALVESQLESKILGDAMDKNDGEGLLVPDGEEGYTEEEKQVVGGVEKSGSGESGEKFSATKQEVLYEKHKNEVNCKFWLQNGDCISLNLSSSGLNGTKEYSIKIVRNYIMGVLIERDSYGKIKEAIDRNTKKKVAIRIVNCKDNHKNLNYELLIRREVELINSLSHPNIIRIQSYFSTKNGAKYYFVLEYAVYKTLENVLKNCVNNSLSPFQARKIFEGLVNGLEYLKRKDIRNGAINLNSLLLDESGVVKIANFKMAERYTSDCLSLNKSSPIRESMFQAPELVTFAFLDKSKFFKPDVWSAGIVLYAMLTGRYPFENECYLYDDAKDECYAIPDWIDEECRDLIRSMLNRDPMERIDIFCIKDHPWMKMYLDESLSISHVVKDSIWGDDKQFVDYLIKAINEYERNNEDKIDKVKATFNDKKVLFRDDPKKRCNLI